MSGKNKNGDMTQEFKTQRQEFERRTLEMLESDLALTRQESEELDAIERRLKESIGGESLERYLGLKKRVFFLEHYRERYRFFYGRHSSIRGSGR